MEQLEVQIPAKLSEYGVCSVRSLAPPSKRTTSSTRYRWFVNIPG